MNRNARPLAIAAVLSLAGCSANSSGGASSGSGQSSSSSPSASAASAASTTGSTGSSGLASVGGSTGATTSASAATSTASSTTGSVGGSTGGVPGIELMTRLGGLWSGQVIDTPLGTFPEMNMDMRPANGHVLFARDDLDKDNSLRFDFSVETFNGASTLVFRNGGLFSGLSRDSRAYLVDSNQSDGTYHFCAEACDLGVGTCTLGTGGCSYVDAVFAFSDASDLVLNVHVKQAQHLIWTAHQEQTASIPDPFPFDETSQGNGTADFPPLPQLAATVSWATALAADTDIWLILSLNACSVGGPCYVSRSLEALAPAGATSAVLVFD